jgi:hypothetical protein
MELVFNQWMKMKKLGIWLLNGMKDRVIGDGGVKIVKKISKSIL